MLSDQNEGQSFRVGDVVQLASDGPRMTIVGPGDEEFMCCEWFNEKNIHQNRQFKAGALVKADFAIEMTDQERLAALGILVERVARQKGAAPD